MKRILSFSLLVILVVMLSLSTTPSRAYMAQRLETSDLLLADSDSDGLADSDELTLGTDPFNVDSDCDYIDDGTEVGNPASPTDSDSDGIIDALENNRADSDHDGTKDHQDNGPAIQATCGRFKPFAIANNDTDAARLEVRVTGSGVTAVTIQAPTYSGAARLRLDGADLASGASVTLYDDGTHGDQRAGDGVWSRGGFTSVYIPSWWGQDFRFYSLTVNGSPIDWSDYTNGPFAPNQNWISLAVVKASDAQTPVAMRTGVQAASNLLNIHNPKGSLDPKAAYGSNARRQAAAYSFYQVMGDDYDFIFFFSDARIAASYAAFYYGVQNDVQNIGKSLYNDSAQYGSAGRLHGLMFMNFASNGPTLHELMHQWAAPNLTALGFHQCTDTSHWGVSGVGKGQLGGFDPATLVNLGGGSYRTGLFYPNANGGDSVNYAPLELYLAGFLDASSVPSITMPTSVNCGSLNYDYVNGYTTFSAAGLSSVTINQITATLGGPRIPGAATSQKNFKAAMVILSQDMLTPAEMAFYNGWSKNLGAETGNGSLKSFKEATGGIATLDTTILSQSGPEINIRWTGGGPSIASGDTTPSTTDGTDFGRIKVSGFTKDRTFYIENMGNANLTLNGSPLISIGGPNAADFTVVANPTTPIAPGNAVTFTIRFDPSAEGLRTATVSIASNDADENPYTFTIQGAGGDPVYCPSTHTSQFEYISRVQLNTGDQTSNWSTNGYGDYTASNLTNLQQGGNYQIQVTVRMPRGNYTDYVKVWLDFSQDGEFTADEELNLGSHPSSMSVDQNYTFTGTLSIPAGAPTGSTRMRVLVTDTEAQAIPCSTSQYGETEDYTVTIVTPGAPPGAFVKTSPANGATDVSTSPTLSWGASSGATSYEYCYDTTNDNNCTTWASNGTSTSKALSGLSAGVTYYWHVRAINASGTTYANGSPTAFWSFTTAPAAADHFIYLPLVLRNHTGSVPLERLIIFEALLSPDCGFCQYAAPIIATPITTDLSPNSSAQYILTVDTLGGIDWNKMHAVVIVDYKPDPAQRPYNTYQAVSVAIP